MSPLGSTLCSEFEGWVQLGSERSLRIALFVLNLSKKSMVFLRLEWGLGHTLGKRWGK